MLGGFFDRARRLHRLLWADERLSSLEERADHSRDRIDALKGRVESLQGRQNRLMELVQRTEDRADALKSSLEVPEELVDEFHAWKAGNPVPTRPLVTVLIATYNRARLLTERSVPSVLNQTYDNLELIVVGDGCTDETGEALARIEDPRLTFVNLHERGAYPEDPERRWMVAGTPAMNKGLSMAQGHYITHLDDDDEYLPDRLEKLLGFAAENACDLVWHPFFWETTEGDWKTNEATSFRFSGVTTSSVFYRSWFKGIPWDIDAHRLLEPGDWNRLRRIKYIGPAAARYPEPLLKHYRERNQVR